MKAHLNLILGTLMCSLHTLTMNKMGCCLLVAAIDIYYMCGLNYITQLETRWSSSYVCSACIVGAL